MTTRFNKCKLPLPLTVCSLARISLCYIICPVFLKVLWPLVQEKEEGPNVNSSSNRRALLQEPQREPEGIKTNSEHAHALLCLSKWLPLILFYIQYLFY